MSINNERCPLLPLGSSREIKRNRQTYYYPSFIFLSLISVSVVFVSLLLRFASHPVSSNVGRSSSSTFPVMGSKNNVDDAVVRQQRQRVESRNDDTIRPGSVFRDTRGEPINAHGGGFLLHEGTYYWYGEIKTGSTYLPASNADWGGTRVDLTGISCYSSRDLLRWEYRGNVLPAASDDDDDDRPDRDLHRGNVAERPKVVYNAATGMFVMWLHVDSADYRRARCGVASSDRPEGPFEYVGSFRPNGGEMARDLTVFVDDDARAYLLTSSEDNAAIHVSELATDYLSTVGNYTRIFAGRYMEAPAVFKRGGMYYFVGSGCTAWKPNAARSAVSSSMRGPWRELGNPCRGDGANVTFRSQSTHVLPLGDDRFVFAADRWDEGNLSDSRYVWLPLTFEEESDDPIVRWHDEWSIAL